MTVYVLVYTGYEEDTVIDVFDQWGKADDYAKSQGWSEATNDYYIKEFKVK